MIPIRHTTTAESTRKPRASGDDPHLVDLCDALYM